MTGGDAAVAAKLEALRDRIDAADARLAAAAIERRALVDEIQAIKMTYAIPLSDPVREAQIVARYVAAVAGTRFPASAMAALAVEVVRACRP